MICIEKCRLITILLWIAFAPVAHSSGASLVRRSVHQKLKVIHNEFNSLDYNVGFKMVIENKSDKILNKYFAGNQNTVVSYRIESAS